MLAPPNELMNTACSPRFTIPVSFLFITSIIITAMKTAARTAPMCQLLSVLSAGLGKGCRAAELDVGPAGALPPPHPSPPATGSQPNPSVSRSSQCSGGR